MRNRGPFRLDCQDYGGNRFSDSGHTGVIGRSDPPFIDNGKEIRMSTNLRRSFDAIGAGDETLESLLHIAKQARQAVAQQSPAGAAGRVRLGVLVDGIAIDAGAFHPDASQEPAAREPIVARLGWAVGRLGRFLLRRRNIARATAILLQLDDRALRDIGINRAEIGDVVRHGRDMERWP